MDKNEKWLQWAVELQAIAQGGLFYIKRNRNNFIKIDMVFKDRKKRRFVIIKLVSEQLYYTISCEKLFDFSNKKMPYLCGLWRFANA